MAKIEALENNKVKITFEISAEEFAEAIKQAYHKNGKKISIPGFRKGKAAPIGLIERYYGEAVFYEDAFDIVYNKVVPEAVRENDLYPAQPELDVSKISKTDGLVFTAVFEKNPYLNLGEYKGIELKKTDYTVHKKDVEAEVEHRLSHIREDHSRLVAKDSSVENGDVVEIDYSGSVDGVKFEGGTAEHQNLTIGSGAFIPGFEEQLIGMNVGETRNINVKFPDEYHSKELAGKDAVFEVVLHSVAAKELPELDDDFASEISDYDTFEEYRKSIYKEVEAETKSEHENKKINDAVLKAVEASESFIPEEMIAEQAESMAHDSMSRFGMHNMDFETFCSMLNIDPVEFVESFKDNAEKRIKSEMLLGKIADEEKIEISDDEVKAEAEKLVKQYSTENTTDDDKAKMLDMLINSQRTMLIYQMRIERAQKVIMDNVVMK